MEMLAEEQLVPVSLCQYVLRERLVREFQIYVYLKCLTTAGTIVLKRKDINNMANDLGLNRKTVKRALQSAIQLNWIGNNGCKYYMRSYDTFKMMIGNNSRTHVFYYQDVHKDFKAFLIGAVIGYWVRHIKKKGSRLRSQIKGSGISISPHSSYVPFSNIIISNLLNCSITTASNYKNLARKNKLISVKPQYRITKFPLNELNRLRRYDENNSRAIVAQDGKICYQLPDLIKSNLRYKMVKY